jgi:hypothetical protein
MEKKQIISYILKHHENFKREQIEQALFKSGCTKEQIDAAFNAIEEPHQALPRGHIAIQSCAIEVTKWLKLMRLQAIMMVIIPFVVMLVNVFSRIGGTIAIVISAAIAGYFLYISQNELTRLKKNYGI